MRSGEMRVGAGREIERLGAGAASTVPKRIWTYRESAFVLFDREGQGDAEVAG